MTALLIFIGVFGFASIICITELGGILGIKGYLEFEWEKRSRKRYKKFFLLFSILLVICLTTYLYLNKIYPLGIIASLVLGIVVPLFVLWLLYLWSSRYRKK